MVVVRCVLVLSIAAGIAVGDDPVPVRVERVIERDVAAGKVFVGTLMPARRSVVGSAVAGKVEKVLVQEGDLVGNVDEGAQKAPLVELRLNAAQIELAAAQADLEVARQELAKLVAGPRAEEIQRLEALVKASAIVHEYAEKRFDKLERLFERDATNQNELDEALSAKLAAEQTWLAARADHEAAVRGTRKEDLARARAQETRAAEEVNRLQDQLEQHTIRAPFRGYVARCHVEQGAWIQTGDPVFEIIELDPVEVRVAVPEEFVSTVTEGQMVRVDVAAVRSGTGEAGILIGEVFRVIPDADARSRSFPVRIRLHNPDDGRLPLLKPGMLARVTLPVGRREAGLLVPKDALVLDRDRASLFTVDASSEPPTVQQVAVDVGSAQDLWIRVRPLKGELQPGVTVVTEGNERLSSGQAIRILKD